MFETLSLVFDEIKHANVHIFEEHFSRTSRKTRTQTHFATATNYRNYVREKMPSWGQFGEKLLREFGEEHTPDKGAEKQTQP